MTSLSCPAQLHLPIDGVVCISLGSQKYPGLFALVDEEDVERVSQWHWSVDKSPWNIYARTYDPATGRNMRMHRFIMDAPQGILVDHINGNGLDNRRSSNLRLATPAQNSQNSKRPNTNTSGYKGVYWQKAAKKWEASISIRNRHVPISYHDDRMDAARAYDAAAREHFGEFARLNFP